MYVCLCQAVTDTEIKDAVMSGATDLDDVQSVLGVSTGCGTCQEAALDLINETLRSAAERLSHAA